MIRLLYEDEATPLDVPNIYGGDFHKDIKLYDVVKCCGYDWYVIGIEDGIVTLLAKDDVFGKSVFDRNSGGYRSSEIRKYINNRVLSKLRNANPIPTELNDFGITDKVWLLSTDEAKKLPENIRRIDDGWWLRSFGYNWNIAACVYDTGRVSAGGCHMSQRGSVRPAMRVHIKDLD